MPNLPTSPRENPTPFQTQLAELNHFRAAFLGKHIGTDPLQVEHYLNKLPPEFDDLAKHFSLEWALIHLTEHDACLSVPAIVENCREHGVNRKFLELFQTLFSEEFYYEEWDSSLADPYEHDEMRAKIAKLRGILSFFSMDPTIVQGLKKRLRMSLAIETVWFGIQTPQALIDQLDDEEKDELAGAISQSAALEAVKKDPDYTLKSLVSVGVIDQSVLLLSKQCREQVTAAFQTTPIETGNDTVPTDEELRRHSEDFFSLLQKYDDPGVIIDIILKA